MSDLRCPWRLPMGLTVSSASPNWLVKSHQSALFKSEKEWVGPSLSQGSNRATHSTNTFLFHRCLWHGTSSASIAPMSGDLHLFHQYIFSQ